MFRATDPLERYREGRGKQVDIKTQLVRMADLTKDERKAVSKTVNPALKGDGFDHTYICNGEIFEMLHCFHVHDYATEPCMPEIEAMERCIDRRAVDPDPRVLARKWQVNMRASVFQLFATNKLHGPRRLGR